MCPADQKPFDGKLSTFPEYSDTAGSQNACGLYFFRIPRAEGVPTRDLN